MEYIAILMNIGLKRAISLKIQENRTEPKLKGNTIGNKGGKAAIIRILSSYFIVIRIICFIQDTYTYYRYG